MLPCRNAAVFLFVLLPSTKIGFAQSGPTVAAGGVLNAASFTKGQPVTLGSFVAIFGSGFGSGGVTSTLPWPTSLGGTSVTMNGIAAPLYAVTDTQINAQVPFETLAGQTSGPVNVVVQRGGQNSPPVSFQVVPFAPGIFSIAGNGLGLANAINPDGALAAPSGSVPPYAAHPATPGGVIIVLATGLGAVDTPLGSGQASTDALRRTTTIPTVLVGGIPAQVAFSGLSPQFPAVNQLNITLPPGVATGASVPLQLSVGGITTSAQLNIAIAASTATSSLSLVTTVPTPLSQPKSVAFYGSFAYICGSQYVAVLDVSSPGSPRLLTTVGTTAFNNVGNLWCYVDSGNLVAFADTGSTLVAGTGPSVTVFSLANPAAPRLLNQSALNKQFVTGVVHRGNTAFATYNSISFSGSTFLNQGGDFISVDVSNPASPRILNTLSGNNSVSGGPSGFFDIVAVNDTTAFAASSTSAGSQTSSGTGVLVVVDTSDPNNLRAVKQVPVPGTRQVLSVVVQGNLAVALGAVEGWRNPVDFSQGAIVGPSVITTFDISDPRNPVLTASSNPGEQPGLSGGGGVAIGSGQFAFAGTRSGTQSLVLLVDARSPSSVRVATVNTPDILHRVDVAAPNFLYALVDNTGLVVYRIN